MRLLSRTGFSPAALAAAVLAVAALPAAVIIPLPVHGQTITVEVGESATLTVAPGARVGIPLRVDLSAAGTTLNLASLQGTLSWGATRLTFDSVRVNAATGFTQTANTTGAPTGSAGLSYFSSTRLTASATLATAWFTASTTTGGTQVAFAATGAGNEAGTSILAQLRSRALAVCVAAAGGRWGDVNDDGSVSIIDAQQIARASVGLSVANATAVAARGDVNADNTVSIIDAQQIARFSVGLSSAARINTTLGGGVTASAITLAPSSAQTLAVGASVTLVATPRDASNADLTGCAPVTWSSSAPAVATVSSSGVVQGVAAGTATITATSGSATATVAVTVGTTNTCAPVAIALGDSVAGTLAATDCASPRVTGGFEDRYTYTATASTPVEIRQRSTAFDTYLQVRNATGAVVFENDDETDANRNSFLSVTLPAGSYTIAAGSYDAAITGAYSLTFRRPSVPPTIAYTTAAGGSIAMLEPGASVTTTTTVRDGTGAIVTPAVTYSVRDDSVARVVTGGIQARSRSGTTPGTFVVAEATTLSPVPAESIWVLVPRTAAGPVLRTDLTSYRLAPTSGTAVTFNVVLDMRNAAHLGAADFDLVYPTALFFGTAAGTLSPVVNPASGVTFRSQGLSGSIGRISFSYARPSLPGPTNDGVVPIAQVTLYSRGSSASFPYGTLTLIPGSIVSATLADLLSSTTAFTYPLVVRSP